MLLFILHLVCTLSWIKQLSRDAVAQSFASVAVGILCCTLVALSDEETDDLVGRGAPTNYRTES